MDLYLCDYKPEKGLFKLIPKNKKTFIIANAKDYSNDLVKRKEKERKNSKWLKKFGLDTEILDLREYFGKKNLLRKKIGTAGVLWVSGGNTFVLRQAMHLSGFDEILKSLIKKKNILYCGSSAGTCIMGPSLKGLNLVDSIKPKPYGKIPTIWEGLGILNYVIIPHYRSKHPESKLIEKTVNYCIKNKILFKAIKSGEAIVIRTGELNARNF